jgi:hypothetical protein
MMLIAASTLQAQGLQQPQVILLTAPTNVAPQQDNTCLDRVKACEQVVEAGQKYIIVLNKQVEKQNELIKQLEQDAQLLKQQVDYVTPKWYERPSFVVPTTIIATAATIFLIRKASKD